MTIRGLRGVAIACSACCLVALAALYQPWHAFRETSWAICWAPDCDAGSTTSSSDEFDTGISHTGVAPVVILAIAAGVALAGAAMPRRPVRLGVGIATLVLVIVAGGLVFKATFLAHMFDHARSMWGEQLCALAGVAACSAGIVLIAVRDQRLATAAAPGRSAGYPPPSPRSPGS